MLCLSKLESEVRNFCTTTGKSFEAMMSVLSDKEFSELVINNDSHTKVITIDSHCRAPCC